MNRRELLEGLILMLLERKKPRIVSQPTRTVPDQRSIRAQASHRIGERGAFDAPRPIEPPSLQAP
jgi:hypothetical protein